MSFLVVANFKSNKTLSQAKDWIDAVTPSPSLVVAPSFPHLSLFSKYASAGQDVSPFPPGSYTGAVNAQQLRDLGVTYCLIGHSERRQYFHETNQDVANKAKELLDVKITPIICLREEDILPQSVALDSDLLSRCFFCYEPPGDIGGTVAAPLTQITRVTAHIKQVYGVSQVMYGGSVNAQNISELLPLHLAGVIVSTACLNPESFNQIIQQVVHAKI